MSDTSQFVWAQASTFTAAATTKAPSAIPQPHVRLNQLDDSAAQINQDAVRQLTEKRIDGSIRRIELPETTAQKIAAPHIEISEPATPTVDWRTLVHSTVEIGGSRDIELAQAAPPILDEPPVDEQPEADTAETDSSIEPLNAAWEVDRFRWPEAVTQLFEEQHEQFEQAGKHLRAATNEGLRVLGVTGLQRGEGRTAISLCLAQAAAEAGVQVALIDGDLARPGLARQLHLRVAADWRQVAGGETELTEAAIQSIEDGYTLFPLIGGDDASIVSPADLSGLIGKIAYHFSLVIVDLGPLELKQAFLQDRQGQCPLDACIVVRDLRHQGIAPIHAAAEHLLQSGVEAVGIAQNFAQA